MPDRERPDWKALVLHHARASGVDLPVHTVDELAAHLEDLYLEARAAGRPDEDAYAAA